MTFSVAWATCLFALVSILALMEPVREKQINWSRAEATDKVYSA